MPVKKSNIKYLEALISSRSPTKTQQQQVAKDYDVQEIYSTITPEQNAYIYDLMSQAENECIRFKVVPNLSHFFSKPVIVDFIRDLPVLSLRSEPLEDVGNRLKKRILDLIISSVVIIFILSWLIPLICLLILIESRGPIFFSQKRTGKNNLPFNCLKFRSMKINKDSDAIQATKNDQRITKIGKFLRRSSLDEFPQFINVFKGEMSLVGPRPCLFNQTELMTEREKLGVYLVKPGITGLAQIMGIDMSTPLLLAQTDAKMLQNLTIKNYFKYILRTVTGAGQGDRIK